MVAHDPLNWLNEHRAKIPRGGLASHHLHALLQLSSNSRVFHVLRGMRVRRGRGERGKGWSRRVVIRNQVSERVMGKDEVGPWQKHSLAIHTNIFSYLVGPHVATCGIHLRNYDQGREEVCMCGCMHICVCAVCVCVCVCVWCVCVCTCVCVFVAVVSVVYLAERQGS